jgi:hypothetical protein
MKTKLLFAALLLSVFTLSAQEAKYEIKSAIITKSMDMMGQKIDGVQYIDDFGVKESIMLKMPMQGVEGMYMRLRSITKGDTVITANLDLKTGNKIVLPEKPVNYLKLTDEVREKYKIKEHAKEEIAGKLCNKYSLVISQMGQQASTTTWVWKGIVLKSVISVSGMSMTEEVIDIQENVKIDSENFTIPNDIIMQ